MNGKGGGELNHFEDWGFKYSVEGTSRGGYDKGQKKGIGR